jgi:hypothetical protein
MWRRGANFEGDTANFIETEQLLELEEFKFSFLQVLFYINEYLVPVFSDFPIFRLIVSPCNWLCFLQAYYVLRIRNVFKY